MNAASNTRETVQTAVKNVKSARTGRLPATGLSAGSHARAEAPNATATPTATMEAIVTAELMRRTTGSFPSGMKRTREMLNPSVERVARNVALEISVAARPMSASVNRRAAMIQNTSPRAPATISVAMRYPEARASGPVSLAQSPRMRIMYGASTINRPREFRLRDARIPQNPDVAHSSPAGIPEIPTPYVRNHPATVEASTTRYASRDLRFAIARRTPAYPSMRPRRNGPTDGGASPAEAAPGWGRPASRLASATPRRAAFHGMPAATCRQG